MLYIANFSGDPKPGNEIESLVWATSKDTDKTWEMGKLVLEDLKKKNLIDWYRDKKSFYSGFDK